MIDSLVLDDRFTSCWVDECIVGDRYDLTDP